MIARCSHVETSIRRIRAPFPDKHAITLVEILVVLLLLLVIGAVGLVVGHRWVIKKRVEKSEQDLRTIAQALKARSVDYSQFPMTDAYFRSPERVLMDMKNDADNLRRKGRIVDYEDVVKRLHFKGRTGNTAQPTYDSLVEHYMGDYSPLTTPIAYLKDVPVDHFASGEKPRYRYGISPVEFGRWILAGNGPDGDADLDVNRFGRSGGRWEPPLKRGDPIYTWYFGLDRPLLDYMYDPTNGLKSSGDIILTRDW